MVERVVDHGFTFDAATGLLPAVLAASVQGWGRLDKAPRQASDGAVGVIVFSCVMATGGLLLSLVDMSDALRRALAFALFGVAAICAYVAVRRLRSS